MRINRLNELENYIIRNDSVTFEELTEAFHVSISTMRRDINELLTKGNIEKVHGGVCASKDQPTSPPMSVRTTENNAEKQLIGRLAGSLVKDNSCIFLDSGSTTEKIIPFIAMKENITLITHSLSAMFQASKYPSINLIALGGAYNPNTVSFVGNSTIHSLSSMYMDVVFLSASALSIENGLSNYNYFEAEIKRAVIAQNKGKSIVAMVDHSKFDKTAAFNFCSPKDITTIVTDIEPSEEIYSRLKLGKIQCIFG